MGETPQQMAIRHVASGRRIVEFQEARVNQLRRAGRSADQAEELLRTYRDTLKIFEKHLVEIIGQR